MLKRLLAKSNRRAVNIEEEPGQLESPIGSGRRVVSIEEACRPGFPTDSYQYCIGKFDLKLPVWHTLDKNQAIYPTYDRGWVYILEHVLLSSPDGVAIDVGANIGDTTALMARVARNPILAVEGSGICLEFLIPNAKILGPQVTVIDKNFYAKGVPTAPGAIYITLGQIKQQYAPGKPIALFKTDTDGPDPYFISENFESLRADKCVLFFEFDPLTLINGNLGIFDDVIQKLQEHKYSLILFDNYGRLMMHLDGEYQAVVQNMLQWLLNQTTSGVRHICYYDIWAFPPEKQDQYAHLKAGITDKWSDLKSNTKK